MNFIKLSELVDKTFTINKSFGYKWKMWDAENKKMLVSEQYQDGHRKMYSFETDKGSLDLSSAQVGQCLEKAFRNGVSDIMGKTFEVKSNGQTGKEIRYFLNLQSLKVPSSSEDPGPEEPY